MESKKIKILFVDDAPEILLTLKRMMHNSPWDVSFANGGVEALDFLEQQPFDVVVTDLNMPEINGVKLLKVIQKEYPHLIRIIYSGNLSKESVREVANYTHRFIVKPCTIDKMMNTIENTLFIHNVLDNEKIHNILTNTGSLPSLPAVYTELMDKVDDPQFSLKEASRIIASDIGMSVNILKQVNLLGYSNDITNIETAVTMLGLDTIKAIVLSSHVFSSIKIPSSINFSAEQLTRHCMLTARFAQEIMFEETGDKKQAESAYIAGVLHDLGILLLAVNFPEKFEAVLERVQNANRPISEVERNLIGISHSEIGAYLLALWGFPREILTAVAFHEEPEKHPTESFTILTAVFVGSFFAHHFTNDKLVSETAFKNSTYLKQLDQAGHYPEWESHCRELYDSIPVQ